MSAQFSLQFSSLLLIILPALASAATFTVVNQCPYTVWTAAVPWGGCQLNPSQSWILNANAGTIGGRVWARTGCSFDGRGCGLCQTGDCCRALHCTACGTPPYTLSEFALNQYMNLDFFDISLVDGFNVPMDFIPTCGASCRGIRCAADVVTVGGQCIAELRAAGGCNYPCTVFKTDKYCCNSGRCGPTKCSKYLKGKCCDACSYPKCTFTCRGGTNYKVCPVMSEYSLHENNYPVSTY